MSEQTLIDGCLRNDLVAQRELYERFSPKMLAVCHRYAVNREDAEDMLQEGFVKVFLQIRSFEARGSFEGWIRRIMVHTCINHLKKNKKFQDNLDIIHAHGIPTRTEAIPSIVQAKQIAECIRSLPVGYRTVLNLFAIEGYSHREIAAMLDIEESTSRSQYTRAKNLLEQLLIQRNILPPHKQKSDWLVAAR
jgi:RNA polymerase sigma-70 factor (ECF subfamily)